MPASAPVSESRSDPVAREPVLVMVGNPNCGKSTIFNALTGLKQKVANYPGVTVEKREGTCFSQHGKRLRLIDLPGTYSLNARSPDEAVVRDVEGHDIAVTPLLAGIGPSIPVFLQGEVLFYGFHDGPAPPQVRHDDVRTAGFGQGPEAPTGVAGIGKAHFGRAFYERAHGRLGAVIRALVEEDGSGQ